MAQVSDITFTDDGKPVYGGSVGINPIIDLLVQRKKTDTKPFFEAMLINFYTMLRNCFDKDPNVVERNIEQEFIHLGVYMSDYFNEVLGHEHQFKIPVIVYFPSYVKVKPPVVRELTAEMQRLVALAPKIKKIMFKSLGGQDYLEMGNVVFYFKEVGGSHSLPYEDLDKFLQRFITDKGFAFRSKSEYLLASHIALDWHLVKMFSQMSLIESYTGKMVPASELGDKLVNDKVKRQIPFSVLTHRVFGDKTLIKPLVTHKKKKLMLQAAEKWKRKPTSMIVSDVARISEQSESYIRSLKL